MYHPAYHPAYRRLCAVLALYLSITLLAACDQPSPAAATAPTATPFVHIDNTGAAPQPTSTPAPPAAQPVAGAQLGGPIVAFDARYGSDNPPGPTYQWNTTIAGQPVQLTVSLSAAGDSLDDQDRAVIIDLTSPDGGSAWSTAQEAAIVAPFLPSDARHTQTVAGSSPLGPDHLYTSQQLAASLSHALFQNAAGLPVTPGTFDWQCSTQQPMCELGLGDNS